MSKLILEKDFDEEVRKNDVLVLVDFYAEWCGPCKMIAPSLIEISEEMKGQVKIVKVDIDNSPKLVNEFEIRTVPTLMLFKDGVVLDTFIGVLPKPALIERIKKFV